MENDALQSALPSNFRNKTLCGFELARCNEKIRVWEWENATDKEAAPRVGPSGDG
jgi:hypothetical protein